MPPLGHEFPVERLEGGDLFTGEEEIKKEKTSGYTGNEVRAHSGVGCV